MKEVVAPPVLTEIPEMVSGKATHPLVLKDASFFLSLAGRHPRALAEICMVDHSVSALSTLLNKGVDALHNKHYRYTDVTPAVVKELLRCALSRTCDVKKRVGRRTLGQWPSAVAVCPRARVESCDSWGSFGPKVTPVPSPPKLWAYTF